MALREYKVIEDDKETGEVVEVIINEYPPPIEVTLQDGRTGRLKAFSITSRMNKQWATAAGTPR